MPLHLEPIDVSADLSNVNSVLIASCPICPPVSLAIKEKSPLIEFFRSGIKTRAFEDHVKKLRGELEAKGVRTGSFMVYAPAPTMCLWSKGQRRRFLKRAQDYEAVVVLGCDTALYTVQQALKDTDCRVILGMRTTGFTNAALKFEFPLTVTLEQKARVYDGHKVERLP